MPKLYTGYKNPKDFRYKIIEKLKVKEWEKVQHANINFWCCITIKHCIYESTVLIKEIEFVYKSSHKSVPCLFDTIGLY